MIVGRPHPSHSFIKPHLTIYKIIWVARKNLLINDFFKMKNQYLQDEGLDCSSHLICEVPSEFPKFPMELLRGKFHWELREPYGNLQNPTQMLSYNQLNFITFQD